MLSYGSNDDGDDYGGDDHSDSHYDNSGDGDYDDDDDALSGGAPLVGPGGPGHAGAAQGAQVLRLPPGLLLEVEERKLSPSASRRHQMLPVIPCFR